MTRNVKIRKEWICMEEGCKHTAFTRADLQKHYQLEHDLKQQMRASLTMKGWNYEIE